MHFPSVPQTKNTSAKSREEEEEEGEN